jgi:N-acyl-D-aspartate/D-glutamate deacylase
MGARTPGAGPPSPDRRRVIVTLGFGALNAVALSQLARSARPGQALAGTGDPTTTTVPAAVTDPPAMEGADPEPAAGHTFTTVITGGRVIDPDTGFDAVANVGVDGDRITAITRDAITGTVTIDATDRVVAPGFIDLLSYEPNGYGEWFKIADGVTTNLGMHGLNQDATAFLQRWTDEGSPVHFGGAYDAPFRRSTVLGLDPGEAASASQLDQLADDARAQIAAGWIGVDLEPEYTPGVEYEELRRLAEVAAEVGHTVFVHGRYSDDVAPGTNADTLAEILQLARDTGCSVHVQHLISTGGTFTMDASLATLQQAVDEGIDVTACMYPYDFWATYLGSPRFNDGWQERFHISYGDLEVAGTGERLTESTFRARQRDNLLVAAYGIPEADVVTCLRSPLVMIGSDGILEPGDNNHPRAAGCFSRVLGRYVREEEVLRLVDALAKMTILPARRLQAAAPAMARKGRLQRGADADIVVFDPATVADRSTVADPSQESRGIDWVVVAGTVVKTPDGIDQTQRPGRAITGAM